MPDQKRSLPVRALGRVVQIALKGAGGAVYYAIHGHLPDPAASDPLWRELHPDSDKGEGPGGEGAELPPSI